MHKTFTFSVDPRNPEYRAAATGSWYSKALIIIADREPCRLYTARGGSQQPGLATKAREAF